jgi:hypothetical protein
MSDGTHLTTWVTRETKQRFAGLARHQGLSDSALLKRLVDLMLRASSVGIVASDVGSERLPRGSRLTVRLRLDDRVLLRERAAARGMPPATYVAVLTRAHLRGLAPLPNAELLALKQAVAELREIGRKLRAAGPSRDDAPALLRVCEGLRDHVKGLIRGNLTSWKQGYGEPGN